MSAAADMIDQDVRFELTLAASASARRNRPKGLIVFGVLVLVVAAIFAGLGWRARASASRELTRQATLASEMGVLTDRLRTLRAVVAVTDPGGGDKQVLPITNIQQAAEAAGVSLVGKNPTTRNPQRDERFKLTTYSYSRVSSPTLGPLMSWLRGAQDRVPGLEVSNFELNPNSNGGWIMTVEFTLWEANG